MTSSVNEVPSSSSSSLTLVHPTQEEKLQTWQLNGKSWAGRLSLPAYFRREEHLANQAITRNGGITHWVLVDSTKAPNEREILASCETLRKRALVARAEQDGSGGVEEAVSHGIGSVFCDPRFRGRGYARRMIEELAKKLDTWQQPDGKRTYFTVLYSDIGKQFYSRSGWEAFPSSHIALASAADNTQPGPRPLHAEDLKQLCVIDEASVIKKTMVRRSAEAGKTMVCLIPDWETMQWHHAREEFVAQELFGKAPKVKGAYVHCKDGSRVWCIWSRFFSKAPNGNVLHILRLVIEGEDQLKLGDSNMIRDGTAEDSYDEKVQAIALLLRAAQVEAANWDMSHVELWNPTHLAVSAAQLIDSKTEVMHRDEESIASLRWHHKDYANVEWLGNEKYGWC